MTTKEYKKPETAVLDYLSKYGLMQGQIHEGSNQGGSGQLSNEASVKPFEDEEDENEARRNHEVWDDEE